MTIEYVGPEPENADARDAARYRRLRENWVTCTELGFHGRLSALDAEIDYRLRLDARKAAEKKVIAQAVANLAKDIEADIFKESP